ncbi:hypothetical protein MJO28_013385, partial [Puccinia striiformis f. sp. tritici]
MLIYYFVDASETLKQSVQTVVKDSHDAEASAGQWRHFSNLWLNPISSQFHLFNNPIWSLFKVVGLTFPQCLTGGSPKEDPVFRCGGYVEADEFYGFTEDKKERVIRELKSRPGGNEIIRMNCSPQLAHPFPNYVNDHHVKFTPGDKRFHRNVHSIGFKDRGAALTSFSTSRKTDKQPTLVAQ